MRSSRIYLLATVLMLCLAVVSSPPHAAAHTALVGSDPPDGATLASAPATVYADFDEEVTPTFAALAVTGPDGAAWSSGQPVAAGSRLSTSIRADAPAGTYSVSYRLMAADGHVVEGSWSYAVAPTR